MDYLQPTLVELNLLHNLYQNNPQIGDRQVKQNIWKTKYLQKLIIDQLVVIVYNKISDKSMLPSFCHKQLQLLNYITGKLNLEFNDLIGIMIYLKRLHAINWAQGWSLGISNKTLSYILPVILILYFKMYCDRCYANSYYCSLTHTTLELINQLEMKFMCKIPLYISHQEFQRNIDQYYQESIVFASRYNQIK